MLRAAAAAISTGLDEVSAAPLHAKGQAEVAAPEEGQSTPRNRRDLVDRVDRFAVLDHRDHGRRLVRERHVVRAARAVFAAAPDTESSRAAPASATTRRYRAPSAPSPCGAMIPLRRRRHRRVLVGSGRAIRTMPAVPNARAARQAHVERAPIPWRVLPHRARRNQTRSRL